MNAEIPDSDHIIPPLELVDAIGIVGEHTTGDPPSLQEGSKQTPVGDIPASGPACRPFPFDCVVVVSTRSRKYDHVCRGEFGCWGRRSSRARLEPFLDSTNAAQRQYRPVLLGWGGTGGIAALRRRGKRLEAVHRRRALHYPRWRSHIRDRIYLIQYLVQGCPSCRSSNIAESGSSPSISNTLRTSNQFGISPCSARRVNDSSMIAQSVRLWPTGNREKTRFEYRSAKDNGSIETTSNPESSRMRC